jgi:hypothetical protein
VGLYFSQVNIYFRKLGIISVGTRVFTLLHNWNYAFAHVDIILCTHEITRVKTLLWIFAHVCANVELNICIRGFPWIHTRIYTRSHVDLYICTIRITLVWGHEFTILHTSIYNCVLVELHVCTPENLLFEHVELHVSAHEHLHFRKSEINCCKHGFTGV